MQKVTKMPIGLGMNHLEQEIAVCQLWNKIAEIGGPPDIPFVREFAPKDAWLTNGESGKSLVGEGFIVYYKDFYRLSDKAIELIEKFIEKNETTPTT